ncbi:malate dehydrogenase [Candidatus Obscuribacterales bacterium]|nr:malate dehydrogenase [Candidatus Obscuribacterales bacterium]MBX3137789.1 malate dehydrogenase [Candidatus Obscuribacterales bacterium]MBX3152523.1 malate dehydrogenase [Candidatus Obscuribacterales bacterium]
MSKVTVVGAGNVGATVAQYIAEKDLADVTLVDVVEGLPQGKSLDMLQVSPVHYHDRKIEGSNSYEATKDSDIVVITAGVARKPGMTRDDLLKINANIVRDVATNAIKYSPNAIFIVVSNPLDVMTYLTWKTTKLPHNKVIGMAGVLDSARFQTFIAMETGFSVEDVRAMVLGGHGDLMVPLTRFATVNGIPISEFVSKDKIDALVARTRDGGAEIVKHLKTGSAYYAPGASVVQMVEAILKDKNRLIPCAVLADGHYGLKDVYIGLPCVLGKEGLKQIVDIKLNDEEAAELKKSAESIRENIDKMNELLAVAAV